jgi:hypothetical protein
MPLSFIKSVRNKEVEKQVIADFLRSPLCSYATTKVLSDVVGANEDHLILCSVLGFSSGVAIWGIHAVR